MISRRHFALSLPTLAALSQMPAWAQSGKKTVVIGITLEPPGMDPTAAAATSISEVTHYNIFETLTKINSDGSITPLLASSWEVSDDLRSHTFHLLQGVTFSNGEPFNAQAVKFSFDRAAADNSTNKDKGVFRAMQSVDVLDDHTVRITTEAPNPDFLFYMGQSTAIIVEPKSADDNKNNPVGTGPYQMSNWSKGSSVTLTAWPGFRDADSIRIERATFRVITEPAAEVAAVMARDVDAFPRVTARGRRQFESSKRLQVFTGGSRGKTLMAINPRHKPLDDVRVRRALCMALDRSAIIEAAADGLGVPIGSHYVPGAPGYVDCTDINPYDPERSKALLKEAGVSGLELSLVLPPPPYARQGGEVILAQLAAVGIKARVQNVEWAQWLSNTFSDPYNYDLTIVSHLEPLDLDKFTDPSYYWGYDNPEFNALYDQIQTTPEGEQRNDLFAQAQRMLAEDAVCAWLYQPQWLTVADRNLNGLWEDLPIPANDLTPLNWG